MTDPRPAFDALVFLLGEDRAAVPLSVVREVVPVATMTELPESPPWVRGVLDVRGELVPVLDLWAKIHQTEREFALSDQVIVCETEGRLLGLLVQDVREVHRIEPERLIATSDTIEAASYLLGAYPLEEGSVLLFEISQLVQ